MPDRSLTTAARAYLLHLLGCTLFANKSATNVHVVYLEALRDLSMTERYAWGVAALVHMYDQLNDASLSHSRQLGGYITLLQVTNMFFIHSGSTMFNFKFCYTFIINVYNFNVTFVVLDLRALSLGRGVHR